MTGQTVSHYTIEELLGEGPNGATYSARDTRSKRVVTLKILSSGATATAEQRAAFERDALGACSVNHPCIVSVQEIGSADGVDFLVRDYVSGESLAAVMQRKRLRRKDAIAFAIQIADVLMAAHSSGFTHGAVKPSNILVVGKRGIRVVDFGVARLSEGLTYSPASVPKGLTADRVAYLAPEQVEGQPAGAQSDIFSFGAMLYQMATGRWAFKKDWPIATLDAILKEEPRPIAEVTKRPPKGLEKLLPLCLEKDPAKRHQHIGDFLPALRKLKDEYESGAATKGSFFSDNWERIMQVVFATVLLTAVVWGSVVWWRVRARNTDVKMSLTQLTTGDGLDTEPALSPRGEFIVYASDRQSDGNLDLWLRPLDGGQPRRLTNHASDDHEPAFSPDGRLIAFRSERDGGGIYSISAQGGEPLLIAKEGRRPRYSPDGRMIAYWVGPPGLSPTSEGTSRIYVVDSGGGAPRRLHGEFASASYPVWAPDNAHLLFLGKLDPDQDREETADWWLSNLKPGAARLTGACDAMRRYGLLEDRECAIPGDWWSDYVLFARLSGDSSNLYRVRLTPVDPEVRQPPRRMTSGGALELQPYAAFDGRYVFASQTLNADIWSAPAAVNEGRVTGPMKRLTDAPTAEGYPSLTSDERKLLFQTNRGGLYSAWLRDLTNQSESAATSVSDARQDQLWPRISPDGKRVVYAESRIGQFEHFIAPVGGGAAEVLCDSCGPVVSDWTADSQNVIVESRRPGRPYLGIAVLSVRTRARPEILAHPRQGLMQARLSKDQRLVTFTLRGEAGVTRIYAAPFRGAMPIADSEWIAVTDGKSWDTAPQFSPDGRLIYFTSSRDGFRCIWAQRVDPAARPAGEPIAVQHLHRARRSPSLTPFNGLDLFVGSDQILISLGDLSGGIWLGAPRE